jgi:cytochrome c-type biogenesis protein
VEFSEALSAWWGPALAFAAGVVSFASPCVLPVVPGYLSFISGSQSEGQRRPVVPMLLFVLGFAVVFSALGAFSRVLVPVLRSEWGQRIGGILVVAIGLLMVLYALRIGSPALFAERRPFLSGLRPGVGVRLNVRFFGYPVGRLNVPHVDALLLGSAFAVGWTPCIGPVLAAILTLALAQGGGLWGAALLFFYSLGLGLPFVLLGLGVRRLLRAMRFVGRNYHWFAGVGGALLMAIGVLLATGAWERLLVRLGLLQLIQNFSPPL